MALNPDCTPGWVDPAVDGGFTSRCGCGWSAPASSRSEAKRIQREHRFPPEHLALADRAVDVIADAYDVPRELLEPADPFDLPFIPPRSTR